MNDAEEVRTTGGASGEGPAMEPKKICPLLSLGLSSGVGKNRALPCLGSGCAWWNAKAGRCAVLTGPEA